MWKLLLLSVCAGALPTTASAQDATAIAFSGGIGYAASPETGVNLPMGNVGVTVWLSERWGVNWGVSRSWNESVSPNLINAGELLLSRVNVRYRRRASSFVVTGGAGFLVAARYDYTSVSSCPHCVPPIDRAVDHGRERWSGLSLEALIGTKVSKHLSVHGGLLTDFALDRLYYQPAALLTVEF